MKNQIKEILIARGQTHLADYLDTLPPAQQQTLLTQLASADLSVLDAAENSAPRGHFSPLHAVSRETIARDSGLCRAAGLEAIREGKLGAVLLAGGQGSRLGFSHPKGMFNIGETRVLSIFACLMNNLRTVTEEAGVWIPLFIMTSADNRAETEEFFRENGYFGYSQAHLHFFEQEELPTLDSSGRLMLADAAHIRTAPNGNGGWFASMARTGMLQVLADRQIEWLNVFAVDNVLQRIADPCFFGAVIRSGCSSGAKVVAKASPDERVGVLCLEDGRPSIVEYYEMTEEMRTLRGPDGALAYRYGVILNYLFRVPLLIQTLDVKLPLHCAKKVIPYMQPDGTEIIPDEPNACKFETLALDLVRLQPDCFAYEVDRSREFAPVKNRTGVDSVDTARALLRQNGIAL